MAKIGIITYHRAFSYGARLQAYATATYLNSIGHNAEIIDYSNIGEGPRPGISYKSIKALIKSTISYFLSIPNEDKRRERFQYFLEHYIPLSKQRYSSRDSIQSAEKDYDYIITGSDQVWCPQINLGDLNFLLNFVKDQHKKISYAGSFGVSHLEEKDFLAYKQCLSTFNHITVREKEAQDLVFQMLGFKPDIVLDPTFLLPIEQWSKIAINPLKHKKKYILCFKILSVNPIYYQLINKLHKETGYEIIHIDTSYRYKPIKGHLYSTAGPLEFIGLIRDAEVIVTNSFHGTVFSILFNKPFYTVLNDNGRNSRLTTLADNFDLSNRLVSSPEAIRELFIPIDYSIRKATIQRAISSSQAILRNMLQ